jgi:hypothetical protein
MKKEKVNLNQFKEIRIVSTGYTRPGHRTAEDEVNKLISEGWELLETYTTCYSNTPPLTSQQEVHFVLGRKETTQDCQFFTTPRPA